MVSVSVVVPCYNYGHLLAGCLDSVLSQPGVDVDVLIVDDCSPDGSADVAHRLAAADPRVRVIAHERNRGHIATYNEGLALVDGAYTVLLSADDLLTPGSLRRSVDLMESDSGIAFSYGYAVPFDGVGPTPVPRTRRPRSRVWPGERWIERRCTTGTNIISSPEVVVRTSAQRAAGGYREDLPHSGDLEMWLRLAARGSVGVLTGVDQALYRVHRQSMSRTSFREALPDLRQRHAAFEAFFDARPALGRPTELRTAAATATARKALWRAARMSRFPEADAQEGATALAAFALQIAPDVTSSPEYRAWSVARGLQAPSLPARLEVLATGARTRAELMAYRWGRRWRCV